MSYIKFINKRLFFVIFIIYICFNNIIFFSACFKEKIEINDDGSYKNINSGSDFIDFSQISKRQIEILESILNKTIDNVKIQDIEQVTNISIVGNHASKNEYMRSFSPSSYKYGGKHYEYINDYGNDLSILKIFTSLETLTICFTPSLSDLSFLSKLEKLYSLRIEMTNVYDFSCLSNLENLTSIIIQCTPIEKIKFNEKNKIKELYISKAYISDATVFTILNEIETLSVTYNKIIIENLNNLNNLTNLKRLEIIAPESNFSFLENLKADLNYLVIGGSDNIDLKNILHFNDTLNDFTLINSKNTDLTPLDELNKLNNITLYNVSDSIKGKKTSPEAIGFNDLQISADVYDWYEYEK